MATSAPSPASKRERRDHLVPGSDSALVFIADGVTEGRVRPEDYWFYLVALFVLPIPVRLVITWLYNASGQSVPIVGLFHAGLGIATGSAFLPPIAPGFQTAWVYAAFAVLAAVVLVVTRAAWHRT